ncbi:MAG: hypothetical protein AVDCRST_MAG40-2702, partial [uncultured Gemmatimonadaceae bacterium]
PRGALGGRAPEGRARRPGRRRRGGTRRARDGRLVRRGGARRQPAQLRAVRRAARGGV